MGDGTLHEMVVRHELQHTETMPTMSLGGLWMPPDLPNRPSLDSRRSSQGHSGSRSRPPRSSWAQAPTASLTTTSASATPSSLPAFCISRLPVSNAQWRQFCDRGRLRAQRVVVRRRVGLAAGHRVALRSQGRRRRGSRPVCHLSFHEAQALARCHGARLPSEAEWERAAEIDALAGVGEVWEWTGSEFAAYPGFAAHPYHEYSEVFFGKGYRVLRGGSFAAHPRVATRTFRNWDLPERRQIFAGLRFANDL